MKFYEVEVLTMKVSIFATCISDIMFPNVAKNTVEILERLGCVVDFPATKHVVDNLPITAGISKKLKNL